ncbi:hypothetical protein JCM1840_003804 [Sporobolomyces johnsonii]
MSCSNDFHPEDDVAAGFAVRLHRLNEEHSKAVLRQSILQGEYKSLIDDLDAAAFRDPSLYERLQGELAKGQGGPRGQLPSFDSPVQPMEDSTGDFLCGPLDEDIYSDYRTAASRPLGDSPPFGPTETLPEPLNLAALDALPPLPDYSSSIAEIEPMLLDLSSTSQASIPMSNCASSLGSSPPSSFTASPFSWGVATPLGGSWSSPSSFLFHSPPAQSSALSCSPFDFDLSLRLPSSISRPLPAKTEQALFEAQLCDILASPMFDDQSVGIPGLPESLLSSRQGRTRSRSSSPGSNTRRFSRHRTVLSSATSSSAQSSNKHSSLSSQPLTRETPRTTRTLKDDPSLRIVKNSEHVTAVHAQLKDP